ncbi:MAG: hypothetical protein ACRDG3_10105 [Tepidiformaceae bacterium]
MKWPARLHEINEQTPAAKDSKLARWLERARLGNRWAAASADAIDDAADPSQPSGGVDATGRPPVHD